MPHYKPRARLVLTVPKAGSATEVVTYDPHIITAKWERNDHRTADTLQVTLPFREAGADPRILRNASAAFHLWDANVGALDVSKHLRFTGVCKSAERKLGAESALVDLVFHDNTDFFLTSSPFPASGIPEFTDTIRTAWYKVCDHVGYSDAATGARVSSVEALKNALVITRPELESRTFADSMPARFHAIGKPSPPTTASAWEVWSRMLASIGCFSYVDRDEVIVTDHVDHFADTTTCAVFAWGENIAELTEKVDTRIAGKGVLLQALNPITGEVLEAAYPPPGDPRLTGRQTIARSAKKPGPNLITNAKDYEIFAAPAGVATLTALDRVAREVYEQRARQELQGSFKTSEMRVRSRDGGVVDVLELFSGDSIGIGVDRASRDLLLAKGSVSERVAYLVDLGMAAETARIIVQNVEDHDELFDTTFKLKTLAVELGPENFGIEIGFQNRILVN